MLWAVFSYSGRSFSSPSMSFAKLRWQKEWIEGEREREEERERESEISVERGKKRNRIWLLFQDKRKTNFRNWFINYFQIICLVGWCFCSWLYMVVIVRSLVWNTKTLVIIYCKVGVGVAVLWALCLITMPGVSITGISFCFAKKNGQLFFFFFSLAKIGNKPTAFARQMCNRLFNRSCWQSF